MFLELNRRSFLAGLLSSLGISLVPGGLRAADGEAPSKAPNLVFGVLSDTHLRRKRGVGRRNERPAPTFPTRYFRNALTYFREQGVDAVVHCGDFAHRGLLCEMKFHADIWFKVFPKNKGKDGKVVEKLFVTGNHDWIGATYQGFAAEVYPNPEERKRKTLATDIAKSWQALWHEPYTRSWHKCVKGYHFFGEHFEGAYRELAGKIAKHAKTCKLKGTRPFFVLQHMIPRKSLRNALGKYPNALAFFGHWHQSLTSERVIRCGTFPIVQCGSLRKNGHFGVPGCTFDEKEAELLVAQGEDCSRHGLLVKVYDDQIVFSRRDFVSDAPLGPDWVMPLGRYKPHPFAGKELVTKTGAPAFPADAKLVVRRTPDALVVEIPQANASAAARAYAFDLQVLGADGKETFRIARHAAGCNFAPTSARACAATKVTIPAAKLPGKDAYTLVVTPVSSLGVRGAPARPVRVVADFAVNENLTLKDLSRPPSR